MAAVSIAGNLIVSQPGFSWLTDGRSNRIDGSRENGSGSGSDLFAAAVRAYADAGFAGEEQRHHQGGAIGYRSREWIAHPASEEVAQGRQAFAWNPSISGARVEDTALLTENGIEIITNTPGWPALPIAVNGRPHHASGVLSLNA